MTAISAKDITIRPARIEDADALSELEILARPTDPSWTFRFPYREQFPDDHREFNRAKYEYLRSSKGTFEVILAEAPSRYHPDKRVPIGVSIWNMKKAPWYNTTEDHAGAIRAAKPDRKRRDEHPARHAKLHKLHEEVHAFFFSPTFGVDKHLYLMILAVHPDYQRLGAATMLCRWGVERASQYPGCQMSVISSHMDSKRRIYDCRLGFRSLGAAVCRADDDDVEEQRECRMECLIWDPKDKRS